MAGLSTIDDKSFSRLSQLAVQAALGAIDSESVESIGYLYIITSL